MQRRLSCSLVLLALAGCPRKSPAPPPPPTVPGVGCPTAKDVYVASYVQPPEGEQGHTGWVLPLHDAKVASVQGQPGFAPLDAAGAAAAGVPAPPRTIWLLPANAPMCKATIGAYYVAAIDTAVPNLAYGVELTGCPAPTDSADAIALVSDGPPSACTVTPPKPVAARLGTLDKQQRWTPPTTATPIPPALDALVPAKDCAAPCEKLWSIAQVDLDGAPVAWAGAVNWLTPTAGGTCPYTTDAWSGFFVAGPTGAPVQVTDGQDHPLALTVVLGDKTGRRVLLAQGTGEYATYDLVAGAATLGRHLVWLVDGPEAYAGLDHLGPECPAPAP